MRNRIDLSNFNIRTDLVIDNEIKDNDINKKKISDSILVSSIEVNDELGIRLGKRAGSYITIEFDDVTNHEDCVEIVNVLSDELGALLDKKGISKNDSCLVIGLGNRASTADSLGPVTLDKVMVTRHLFVLNTDVKDGIREVSGISPGVMANTGIETYDIISGLIDKIKPKFLIVIDALASSSIDRVNKTIQITDTGIHPGSGIGNNRKEISCDVFGIPVIAIGVPTVVESSILVSDTINYMFQHISYIKNNYESNKLVCGHNNTKKYLNTLKNFELNDQEKERLSGILGTLDDDKKKELIYEVLNSINYNMIVTPKEIDFLIDKLSSIIGSAINKCLHSAVNGISIK